MKKIALKLLLFSLLPFTVPPAEAAEIHLFCAASLREAMGELTKRFTQGHPSVKVNSNFGASGTLAKQIENGAPAHLFISANQEWSDYLKQKKLVLPSTGNLAFNSLVFAGIGRHGVSGMADLVRLQRIAIGSPKSVPAGAYALQALRSAGLAGVLTGKLIMARDVREGLMYAERGEVDGAFVYRTDALQAKRAKVLFAVPKALYPRVAYPVAVTPSGAANKEAAAFHSYLKSNDARKILSRHGFSTVN